MSRLLHGAVVAGLALMPMWIAAAPAAIDVHDIVMLEPEPLAPQGGIMMVKGSWADSVSG